MRTVALGLGWMIGFAVLLSHKLGADMIARGFVEGAVTMKPATAIAIMWCAVAVFAALRARRSGMTALVLLASCIGAVVGIAEPWLLHGLAGVAHVVDTSVAFTVVPGIPSLTTALCVAAIVVGCLARGVQRRAGALALCVASVALVGHFLGVPWLFGYVPGWSTGMAIPTALAFVLLGATLSLPRRTIQ